MIDLQAIFQCYHLEVTKQDKKAFTRGIDSPQLQLLCRSSDSNISLDDIQWTSKLNPSLSLQNPFIVNTLSDGNHDLQCNIGSDTSFTSTIVVQGNFKHIKPNMHFKE